jgi:hypothetical protein
MCETGPVIVYLPGEMRRCWSTTTNQKLLSSFRCGRKASRSQKGWLEERFQTSSGQVPNRPAQQVCHLPCPLFERRS